MIKMHKTTSRNAFFMDASNRIIPSLAYNRGEKLCQMAETNRTGKAEATQLIAHSFDEIKGRRDDEEHDFAESGLAEVGRFELSVAG